MTDQAIARGLLVVLCILQGLATIVIDLDHFHATNPGWPGHARFHLVWQVVTVALLAVLEVVRVLSGGPLQPQRFILPRSYGSACRPGPRHRSRAGTSAIPDGGAGRRTWRSPAFQSAHGREQRGGSVALVVVGHGSAAALLHRQPGLGAVQRLNLALFVGAQHDGVFGRIQIQADDVLQFLGELGIAAELESARQCGFRPWARQMRRTLFSLMPAARAMRARLQWVALAGFSCSVISTTRFTRRSVMMRVRPA